MVIGNDHGGVTEAKGRRMEEAGAWDAKTICVAPRGITSADEEVIVGVGVVATASSVVPIMARFVATTDEADQALPHALA